MYSKFKMNLGRRIFLSFFISAFLIAALSAYHYVNFTQVRAEIALLQTTDTIRSHSLQLRRHEKNYFLYPDTAAQELKAIESYLDQMDSVSAHLQGHGQGKALRDQVLGYRIKMAEINAMRAEILSGLSIVVARQPAYSKFLPLMSAEVLDRPAYLADFLIAELTLPNNHVMVRDLRKMEALISDLRKTGEDIITEAKALDTEARGKAERGIHMSQTAILVVFPVFLALGLGISFYISRDAARRLRALRRVLEGIEARYAGDHPLAQPKNKAQDEVGSLIEAIGRMEAQLLVWEAELREKNKEVAEARRLAAIGTLASGVAHELNNPLNNISLSAQVLLKQMGEESPAALRENVQDIFGQTLRVKGIVRDLLEFARQRDPNFAELDLRETLLHAYTLMSKARGGVMNMEFLLQVPQGMSLMADAGLMERLFVNLFENAADAMQGKGTLSVTAKPLPSEEHHGQCISIEVLDTGPGIPEEARDKVFDPFYSTKDKGTGLGLAIVMNIVRSHGGRIEVRAAQPGGSVFAVRLPVAHNNIDGGDNKGGGAGNGV